MRRIVVVLMCVALVFTMTACGESKKEKEAKEKARLEKIQEENEAAANAVISSIESLPDEITLKDETAVIGARSAYDELTDDQKALVPAEMLARLEDAEKTIEELTRAEEERQKNMEADKEAAAQTEEIINGIPDKITEDAQSAVEQARASYNQLTDDQKSYVSKDAVKKLTSAEDKLKELEEEAEKKAKEEAEKKKAKEKEKAKKAKEKKEKAEKEKAKKKAEEEAKKKAEKEKENKYKTAKKYVGKSASALIKAIGKPKKKKKNPNCATDGEEYIYYYDGFYVGVLSQDMESPLIVQNVTKN